MRYSPDNAMNKLCTKNIEWLGIQLRVPGEWEIRRHSAALERGSLVLVDRRRQRMQLFWQKSPSPPDLKRSAEDYRKRALNENEGATSRSLPDGTGWTGFMILPPGKAAAESRAMKYQPETGLVLELVITTGTTDGGLEVPLVRELLSNCRATVPPKAAVHWRAFGIDCTVPAGFIMEEAAVKPMDVLFRFRDPGTGRRRRPGRTVSVQRLGMAGEWFDGNLESFALNRDTDSERQTISHVRRRDHDAVRTEGEGKSTPFVRLRKGRRRVERVAWHCEASNCVFLVHACSGVRSPFSTDPVEVRCCGDEEGGAS